MNLKLVEKIANAVLYEGYILYPYRPSSVKNRQRFNFGALMPQSYSLAQRGAENWCMQTECLVLGNRKTLIDVKARFLHLLMREVREPIADGGLHSTHWVDANGSVSDVQAATLDSHFRIVPSLEAEGQLWQTWQEALEREADVTTLKLGDLIEQPQAVPFSFPAKQEIEYLRDSAGQVSGVLVRKQESVEGTIELQVADCGLRIEKEMFEQTRDDNRQPAIGNLQLYKLTVRILNRTWFAKANQKSREEALMCALASTHTILSARGGEFVSLLEPPEEFRDFVAACNNNGTFPVLVGEAGERNLMLSSPIILYDYPQIAPESAGDLFDGTEIDEILLLRILTMTDEEKREMRSVDERARRILERTESLPFEQLMKLHGRMRGQSALEDKKS
jgi:hypothetical protein